MEILNNLWMAISTPNEVLMNIIAVPATLIENLLTILLFSAILNINTTSKQKILYVISMGLVSLFSMYFIPSPYNIFFNFAFVIGLTYFIFKVSFLKSTAAIMASAFGFNIIIFLILNPYITLLNISSEELSSIPIYRLMYIIIVYICVLLIIAIIKSRKLKLVFIDNIDKKTKLLIYTNLILGIATIIFHSITFFYYIDALPIFVTLLSSISLSAYFIISLYSFTKIFKLILTTRKLESAESYNNTLRILHDNVRGFKHDFDNIVTTIGGYIKTNDMEGLKVYYEQLEDDCQRVNNLYLLNPEVVNNDGIYNLLTKKYYEAESKGIKVNITFLLDLSTLNMKIYEFARILGILLDNAIEAASECDNKVINLTFRNDFKNSVQLIIIENTYEDKELNMDKIFEKGVSGKENHTGLGLWEVRKLVNKNNNVKLISKAQNGLFTQQLEIYTQ